MSSKMDEKFNEFSKIHLNSDEKAKIKNNLVNFMLKNPASVRPQGFIRRLISKTSHGLGGLKNSLLVKNKYSMPAIIAILVIALSGGTAAAAQGSLPGEPLYSVKTAITEPLEQAMHLTAEGKANYKIKLIERRLQETEELAVNGNLDAQTAARLEAHFEAHEERLLEIINKLEEQGNDIAAAKLSSRLQATIDFHNQLLNDLESGTEDNAGVLESIKNEVRAKAKIHSDLREKIEANLSQGVEGNTELKQAAEGRIKAASNKLEQVDKYITKKEDRVSAQTIAEARAQLAVAQNTFAEAQAAFEQGNYVESFTQAQKAHREAQQAKLEVSTSNKIEVDLEAQDDNNNDPADNDDSNNSEEENATEGSAEAEVRSEGRLRLDLR